VGYDQLSIENDVKAFIKARGLTIEVVRVGKFGRVDLDSSSKIKRKILSEETSSR
jgi:glycerol-3-phosphate cytidylyltransferase-like family protein